jgi:hypothetical protein
MVDAETILSGAGDRYRATVGEQPDSIGKGRFARTSMRTPNCRALCDSVVIA